MRWEPHAHAADVVRTGARSRWRGAAVEADELRFGWGVPRQSTEPEWSSL
jgi:hypothetical protein